MESFILLPASPTTPLPKILFCWKINHQKVKLHNTHDFFPTQGEVQELYPDFVYKEGKSHIQSPTSHTHMPFCSIKIEVAEVASSTQFMNWCENISRVWKNTQQFQKAQYKRVYFWEDIGTLDKQFVLFTCILLVKNLTG